MGADICTSPFFTMRIDSLLVLLYVTCIAISISVVRQFSLQKYKKFLDGYNNTTYFAIFNHKYRQKDKKSWPLMFIFQKI